MQKPETAFRQRRVVPFLARLEFCRAFPIQQKGFAGDPDFMLCLNSLFVGLELKTDIGHMSVIQKVKSEEIVAAGGVFILARPSNWEVVKQELAKISQKGPKYVYDQEQRTGEQFLWYSGAATF